MNGIMSYDLKGKESKIFKAMDDFANQPKPTLWTPITGEESLPKDDEALCLFVWFFESTNSPSTHSLFCQWKYLRLLSDYEDISSKYTHYTILTKPKQ